MQKIFLLVSIISALLANGLGAFGAHALKSTLTPNLMAAYQTGVQYQFYHSLGLLLIGVLMFHITNSWINLSGMAFIVGIVLFSGSLYLLTMTNISGIGLITPIGGLAFILGWLCLFIGIAQEKLG